MTVRDYLASFVRTIVPGAVALVLGWLATVGIADVDSTALTSVVSGVFLGGYYALIRWAESRWPTVGVLLGWKAQPTYELTAKPNARGVLVTDVDGEDSR